MHAHSRSKMYAVTARVATAGLLTASGVAGLAGVATAAPASKYTICHSTNSESNPYVQITVNESAVDGFGKNDHTHHTGPIWYAGAKADGVDWGDIIPPTPGAPDGVNWDQEGQGILDNGCAMVETPPEDVDPDMSIEKTGTASGQPGDPVSYSLAVQNIGTGPTTGTTTVTDNLPSGLADGTMAYTSGDGVWVCDAVPSATPSCSTDDVLAVGDSTVFTVSSTIESADAFEGLPTTVTDEGAVSTPGDTDETNDTDTFPTDVTAPDEVTNPAVNATKRCGAGISVELSNMDATVPVTFTVTAPDGSTEDVAVNADAIAKRSYKVAEDSTGVVTVTALGLSKKTVTYEKDCADVLGTKTVKNPPKTQPDVLPFTGSETPALLAIAALSLLTGTGLVVAARRRTGAHAA